MDELILSERTTSVRKRTWEIVQPAHSDDKLSWCVDIGILALIFLNVIAVVAGSVDSFQEKWGLYLDWFETLSVIVFTVEYVARLWSCTVVAEYRQPVLGRIRLALRPMTLIDLLAILPFYLPFLGLDLRSIRAIRLLRILRIAKLNRYYSSFVLMRRVAYSKKEELILTSALLSVLLVLSATIMYFCENRVQPDKFSSIPATMWWSVATLTTVGYGDIYPITVAGKICAGIMSILGIGLFALPAGILGAGFVEEIQKPNKVPKTCPHCGREI